MKKQISIVLFIAGAFFFATHSCTYDKLEDFESSGGSQPCSPDSVYFQTQVFPLLVSNCTQSSCHNAMDRADGVDLSSYLKLISTVEKVSNTNWSKNELMEVLLESDPDKRMPYGRPALAQSQIALIQKWVQQGAKNNTCDVNGGACDTTSVVKYSQFVQPLLQAKCTGCHNSSSKQGGIDLSSHDKVRPFATNGSLYNAVSRNSNWMPKGGPKIDNCSIIKLKKWINSGAPNN